MHLFKVFCGFGPLNMVAYSYLIDSELGLLFGLGLAGLSPRQATHFLLLRQKKVSKEKATRLSGALRATCAVRKKRGSAQTHFTAFRSNSARP